jgi:hypothetical protein
MIPTAPLRLRNRLAETILRALGDAAARRELERLAASPEAARDWSEATAEHGALLRTRARCAADALTGSPLLPVEPSLGQALAAAALLFDAGLHFEVHELLEPYWARAEGGERQALQGLIQIAVGYQHLANGNLAGARALLDEGARRLRDGHLTGVDLTQFAGAVSAATACIGNAIPINVPSFPRSGGRSAWGGRSGSRAER